MLEATGFLHKKGDQMKFKVELGKLSGNEKLLQAADALEAINNNINLLLISRLEYYLERDEIDPIIELYTSLPESIAALGYKSLGDLILKNLKLSKIQENEFLYVFDMELDFDLSKLPASDAKSVSQMFFNLYHIISTRGQPKKIIA